MTFSRIILSSFLALAVSAPVLAQGMKTDDQIAYRKATFKFMSMNMGVIKTNIEGNFNAESVKVAANAIAAAAATKPEGLFGEGTDKSAEHKITAKPEVWMDKDKFNQLAGHFKKAADGLMVAATSGDKGKVTAAFGEVGKSCKACHDDFRSK